MISRLSSAVLARVVVALALIFSQVGSSWALPGTVAHGRSFAASAPGWVRSGAKFDLDFANGRYYGGSIDQLLSVSRSGSAYAADASGNLVSFAANTLRRTSAGLLIEEARTNIFTQSVAPRNSLTTTSNASVAASGLLGPDGVSELTNVTSTVSNGFAQWNFTIPNDSLTRVWSLLVPKSTTSTDVGIFIFLVGGTGVTSQLSLNAVTGTLSNTIGTAAITSLGSYWLVSLTATNNTTGNTTAALRFVPSGSATKTVAFACPQFEQGSFPTSYIPTTSGSAARAADNVSIIGPLLTALQGAQGTLVVETNSLPASVSSGSRIVGFPSNALEFLGRSSADKAECNFSTPATAATLGSGGWTGIVKSSIAWDATGVAMAANAGTVVTTTGAPDVPTALRLGSGGAGTYLDGLVRRLTFYPSRVANGSLPGITQ